METKRFTYKEAGELYPRIRLEVIELDDHKFGIIDDTGWDGFSETEPQLLDVSFGTVERACEVASAWVDGEVDGVTVVMNAAPLAGGDPRPVIWTDMGVAESVCALDLDTDVTIHNRYVWTERRDNDRLVFGIDIPALLRVYDAARRLLDKEPGAFRELKKLLR